MSDHSLFIFSVLVELGLPLWMMAWCVMRIQALVTIQSITMTTCSGYAQSTAATGQELSFAV